MVDKFNPANYIKHSRVMVTGENFEPKGTTFTSKLLLIRWQVIGNHPKDDLEQGKPVGRGVIRVSPVITQIGRFPPTDYGLDVFKDVYAQFLDLSSVELDYQLSFKNPKGTLKTQIEINEYVEHVNDVSHKVP